MRLKYQVFFTLFLLLTSACSAPQPAAATLPAATPTAIANTALPTNIPQTAASTPTIEPVSPPTSGAASGQVVFQVIPETSTVQYEVAETFINDNNRLAIAVGITGQIEGEIFADLQNPQNSKLGTFTVDVSQFTSDSSRRDNAIRRNYLESSRFPIATFVPEQIEGLPESYIEGQDYNFRITGNLTVHETTRPVTFDLVSRLQGDTLTGTARATLLMSDFGVGPISLAGILRTEDEVKVTMTFTAKKQ